MALNKYQLTSSPNLDFLRIDTNQRTVTIFRSHKSEKRYVPYAVDQNVASLMIYKALECSSRGTYKCSSYLSVMVVWNAGRRGILMLNDRCTPGKGRKDFTWSLKSDDDGELIAIDGMKFWRSTERRVVSRQRMNGDALSLFLPFSRLTTFPFCSSLKQEGFSLFFFFFFARLTLVQLLNN